MNGKGSKPRNNFSPQFRANFDQVNWKPRVGVKTEGNTQIISVKYACGCTASGHSVATRCPMCNDKISEETVITYEH